MSSYTRTILVTGANTGIGYDLVRLLAEKGENVYLGAINKGKGREAQSKLKNEHNLDVKFVQIDIADLKSVEAARDTIEMAEGKLDVLVNNQSNGDKRILSHGLLSQPFGIDRSAVRHAFNLTLYGTIQTTTAFLPLIRKARKGYGSIQFVSTDMPSRNLRTSAHAVPLNFVVSETSTAELRAYVVSLAKRLQEEDTGITVNAVTPGFATTKSSGIAVHDEHTAEQGARILLPYAQLGPEHVATTGKFFDARGEYVW